MPTTQTAMHPTGEHEQLARVQRLPPTERADVVFSLPWNLFANGVICLVPLTLILPAVVLMFALGTATPIRMAVGIAAVTISLAAQFAWAASFPEWPTNRWLRRRLLAAIGRRADARNWLGDRTTRMVEWVPRDHWSAARLETAEDVLFVSAGAPGLRLEGDRYRITIPAASIIAADLQPVRPPGCFHRLYFVVVTIRTADGPWELPLSLRDHSLGRLSAPRRRHDAHRLRERVQQIADAAEWSFRTPPQLAGDGDARHLDPSQRLPPRAKMLDPNPFAAPRSL